MIELKYLQSNFCQNIQPGAFGDILVLQRFKLQKPFPFGLKKSQNFPVFCGVFTVASWCLCRFDNHVQTTMPNTWSKNFGELILTQRKKRNLPLRKVAAVLDIDTSTLSKIEKGERQANSKMIPVIAEIFGLDFKELQIRYLSQKLNDEFGNEPFFDEALNILNKKTKRNSHKKD